MAVSDRRYRKTESQIENSMLDLLQRQTFDEILVSDVVHQADINRSTFYLHYQSLDAVLGALEDRCITLLSPLASLLSQMDSKQFSKSLVGLVEDHLTLFRGVLLSTTSRFDEKLRDLFFPSLGVVPPLKNKKTMDDQSLLAGTLIVSLRMALTLYFDGNERLDEKKLVDDMASLIDLPLYNDFIKRK
jgi:AcrR family transcriptional regulator